MCGRFSNRYTWRELHALYQLSVGFPPSNFQPDTNIAPTDPAWVVRLNQNGERELASMRFGMVPAWAKDTKIAASMINARAETVAQKFRAPFETRPCLVVADGFYEWRDEGAKKKQAYFITLKDNAPFALGGLWDRWQPRDGGEPLETFTIVTTPPNDFATQVHNRMPLILSPDMWADWFQSVETRARMMEPFPSEPMTMVPVTVPKPSGEDDQVELPAQPRLL